MGMSWNLTEWMVGKYGPYYALRVYAGKGDTHETQDRLQVLVNEYFPKAKVRYRLAASTQLPEYYIYLGKKPMPPELGSKLDIF